jgi:hypothetical protein
MPPGVPSLLFEEALDPRRAGERDGDRSFARDLNFDQIVAAIAGDREERDLITGTLFGHLRDAGVVRYRQEVFVTLTTPPCLVRSGASPASNAGASPRESESQHSPSARASARAVSAASEATGLVSTWNRRFTTSQAALAWETASSFSSNTDSSPMR